MNGFLAHEQLPHIDFEHSLARKRFLLTGGPGFGITSTIAELAALGFETVREAARVVVHREISRAGSTTLPWKDRQAFDDAIATIKVADYQSASSDSIVLFDRGLPDFVGWSHYYGKDFSRFLPLMQRYPYNRLVFFTVPWEEIYVQNKERPMPFEESSKVHDLLVSAYRNMGFEIHFLDKENSRSRALAIRDRLRL